MYTVKWKYGVNIVVLSEFDLIVRANHSYTGTINRGGTTQLPLLRLYKPGKAQHFR